MYPQYPCKPQFCYIKVGFKGVNITRTCFPDVVRAVASFPDHCLLVPCSVAWPTGAQLLFFFSFAPISISCLAPRDLHR